MELGAQAERLCAHLDVAVLAHAPPGMEVGPDGAEWGRAPGERGMRSTWEPAAFYDRCGASLWYGGVIAIP
jgi:hypothetical protein